MKQVIILVIIMTAFQVFQGDRAFADEFRVISFHYPPYTYQDGRDGLAITNIRKAFERAGHRITVDYYPVARSFQKFLQDKNSFFAGHISQFETHDKLGYIVNLSVIHKVLMRMDFVDGATSLRRMAILRDDQLGISIANKMKVQIFNVETNEQAAEMMLSGRLEFLACLAIECETLMTHSGKRLRVLEGSEEPFDLQLIYHRDSEPAKLALLLNEKGFFKTP
ncbi:Transporter substrate-binding domain-containing protein [Gammaproteobacteria bacterium]